jgi:MoaA/NifB/PqqE/SkfB family radical SAM enzyme
MILRAVTENCRKLKENDAFSALLRPQVLANYWRYRKELRERPLVMRSRPPFLEIELTNRCNLACVQCLRSVGLKPYQLGDMEFANYQKILAQFPHLLSVCLNGFGEPLMHPRFFEIVEYTKRARPWAKIVIYSNGMLLDAGKAEQLLRCGLTEINVSLDAARPETYQRVRRGGQLDVVHANIQRLARLKRQRGARFPLLGVNFVLLNDNEGELVPFIEQAQALGVDFVNCISWASYDWGFKNRRCPESYLAELTAARARLETLGLRCKSFPALDIDWTAPDKPFDCDFFWGENFRITYDGHVTLGCCTPFKETFTYGNLLEQPFADLWNGPECQEARQRARQRRPPNAVCASCAHFCKSFFAENNNGHQTYVPLAALTAGHRLKL